jgi:hypothetical protein
MPGQPLKHPEVILLNLVIWVIHVALDDKSSASDAGWAVANSLQTERRKVARPAGLEPAASWFVVAAGTKALVITVHHRVLFRSDGQPSGSPAPATVYY